jgi:hypothetical protein
LVLELGVKNSTRPEPYFSESELRQMDAGVAFFGGVEEDGLADIMGPQNGDGVTLIRHASIRTRAIEAVSAAPCSRPHAAGDPLRGPRRSE